MQLDPIVQKMISQSKKSSIFHAHGSTDSHHFPASRLTDQSNRSGVIIEERIISTRPSGYVTMRIFRPTDTDVLLPPLIYLPGPNWTSRIPQLHDPLLVELCLGAQVAVLMINYSLSPVAKYPVALEECYCVLKWLAENGKQHELDTSRITVAGDGCGGNLAAALTILTKQRSGPKISRQLLLNPATDARCNTPSHQKFATGYYFDHADMIHNWDSYLQRADLYDEIFVSPLQATEDQLQGLPTALIISAEADILRDEGEAYAARLQSAGVRVTQTRFQGTIHGFMTLKSLSNTVATRGAITLAVQWIQETSTKSE